MKNETRKLSLVRDTLATMNDSELDQVNGGNATEWIKMGVDLTTVAIPATVEIWKELRKPPAPKPTDKDTTKRS